jgi:subfamily B ATP-binding cassette protein MsbA
MERIFEILKEAPEDQDSLRTMLLSDPKGEIRFENIGFAYENDKQVLHDICFTAQPGTVTALVGPSGGGKSTIVGLIAAFYNPTLGRIHVDGVDLRTIRIDSYRSHLGAVLQDTFLFDGTIYDNVAFSHSSATREEVLTACRMARVNEFAERFDAGYETIVGERGVKLSGGQRQRVAIARAILAQPRILILDEATSNLDSESEEMIQEGLAHLMRGRTVVVIAHRLSTIRSADQILVLDGGRIVERGNHESLLRRQGLYFALYSRQQLFRDNFVFAPSEAEADGVSLEEA